MGRGLHTVGGGQLTLGLLLGRGRRASWRSGWSFHSGCRIQKRVENYISDLWGGVGSSSIQILPGCLSLSLLLGTGGIGWAEPTVPS